MPTYRVNVVIQRADGPDEHSEVCLGNVQAESIAALVAHASTLGPSFAQSGGADTIPRDEKPCQP